MKSETVSKRNRRKRGIYLLPNLLTTTNLFFAFYSIVSAIRGDYDQAASVIIIAMILDSLDGRIARMTNTMSKFGGEYDSLADLVAFGVSPAVLAYVWSLSAYGKRGFMAAFLFVTCGALRLARFNIQAGLVESRLFNGLPIPAGASVIATGVSFYYYLGGEGKFANLIVMIAVFIVSLLMVSNVKYYSFKDLNFFSRKPFMTFVLIVFVMIFVYMEPQVTLFIFSIGYVISGPFGWLIKQCHRVPKEKSDAITANS